MFKPKMGESDLLVMLSKSTEVRTSQAMCIYERLSYLTKFSQIQVRENEISELEAIMKNKDIVPCQLEEPKVSVPSFCITHHSQLTRG